MPSLKVTFSGLCAFVFDQRLENEQQPPTRATVLLPQLLMSRQLPAQPNTTPEILDAHIPQLIFSSANLAPGSALKSDFTSASGRDLILLYGRELRILPDGKASAAALSVVEGQPTNLLQPNAAELRSLFWMVGLSDAFPPSQGRVNPALLQQFPSSNGHVIAKVHVDGGALSTLAVSDFELAFTPPGNSKFKRRIATKILLEIPIATGASLEIKDTQSAKRLDLAANGSDIAIEISNLEIDNFLPLPSDIVWPAKGSAVDFQAFLDMSAVKSVTPPSLDFVGGLQSLHGGMCPPAALFES